jgi:hypothetical protein
MNGKNIKSLEIIQLRAVDGNRQLLESELGRLIEAVVSDRENPAVVAYRRPMVDTDYCIQLTHDSSGIEASGSPLGLRLAAALKEFGMVSHSVWGEVAPG